MKMTATKIRRALKAFRVWQRVRWSTGNGRPYDDPSRISEPCPYADALIRRQVRWLAYRDGSMTQESLHTGRWVVDEYDDRWRRVWNYADPCRPTSVVRAYVESELARLRTFADSEHVAREVANRHGGRPTARSVWGALRSEARHEERFGPQSTGAYEDGPLSHYSTAYLAYRALTTWHDDSGWYDN